MNNLTNKEFIDALCDMDMKELNEIAGVDPVKAEALTDELTEFLGLEQNENVTLNSNNE